MLFLLKKYIAKLKANWLIYKEDNNNITIPISQLKYLHIKFAPYLYQKKVQTGH